MEQVKTRTDSKVVIKEPDTFIITFFNNNKTTMEGVLLVLGEVFNYSVMDAFPLMMNIHQNEKADIWEGPEDLAQALVTAALTYCVEAPPFLALDHLKIELRKK